MIKLTRDELIERLIADDLNIVLSGDANTYFEDIMREGFIGYKRQSNNLLIQEYLERLDPDNTEEIKIRR